MGAPKGGKGFKGAKGKGKGKAAAFQGKGKGKGAGIKGAAGKGEKWVQVKPTVLVTGCAGFVATSVVRRLLALGYKVRGTMRTIDPSDERVATMKRLFPDLELFEADLLSGEESFVKAMTGCKYVMHCASPFKLSCTDVQKELIEPAVKGTEAALRAAAKAGVSRVVVTSSVASIFSLSEAGKDADKVWSEEDWNLADEPTDGVRGYRVSKVRAEQRAWELAKELDLSVSVICPSFVIGPMLSSRADGESVNFMKQLLDGTSKEKAAKGELKGFPKGVVDVRDVAHAHVQAMEKPEADGKRFLVTSESTYSVVKLAAMLDRFKAYPLPTESQEGVMDLKFSTKRAEDVLGWKAKPVEVSMRDMANAAIRLGICDRKFNKKAAADFGKVKDILPNSRGVYLLASVVSIGEAEETRRDGESIKEVVVGDDTGLVTLRLTSSEVEASGGVGQVAEFRNCGVKMMKGYIRLIVGKWGKVAKHEGGTTVVPNKDKDVSATEYELVAAY